MSNLSTTYLGLKLRSPLVASASPLCETVANIRQMEDAGIGAVVLPSLFEEQLELEGRTVDEDLFRGSDSFPEAAAFFPDLQTYNLGPDGYLKLIQDAKAAVSVPVIASLNGVTPGGWAEYAQLMQDAGADAIELNLYSIPTEISQTAEDVERGYVALVRQVRSCVQLPIAAKVSPVFSSPPNMALQLVDAGATGLVLFNRFYQPDFDIEEQGIVPTLTLSRPEELLLRLHWVAILYGSIDVDLAVTGGVHSAKDVVKCVMAGAQVAMMTSALLQNGIGHAANVLMDLRRWLDEHEYDSVNLMRGSLSRRAVADPGAFERANYMRVLSSYSLSKKARGR